MQSSSEASTSQVKLDTIPLYLIGGKATVWDPQTAATLHCIHNISGLRAGTLPGVTQQNGFLGLPITLMPEETAYLVSQAHLVPVATHPTMPTPGEVERRTQARLERIRQVEAAMRAQEEENKLKAKERFEKGGEKAAAKREARAKAKEEKARAKALAEGLDDTIPHTVESATPPRSSADTAPPPPSSVTKTITGNHFHPVPSHPLFPRLAHQPPITSIPHPLFPFPETPRDKALVATFTDLLKRGLRIGLGPRFGGEYLVYPGDYLRYHAHFTSQILVRDEPLKPTEIVAWGRLGTGTKKAGLICCWDDGARPGESGNGDEGREGGGVEYYSLEWSSFG